MPRGRWPSVMALTCSRLATSTMSSESASSALTYSHLPSGLNSACSGFLPLVVTLNSTLPVAVETKLTLLLISLAATIHSPFGDMPTPSGDSCSAMRPLVLRVARSTTSSELLDRSLTYSSLPSLPNAMPRGLPPVWMVSTTASLAQSMTETVPDFSFGT